MIGCNVDPIFDVILSGIALLVFLPLLAPIMVFLKFSGEGEVFFSSRACWQK